MRIPMIESKAYPISPDALDRPDRFHLVHISAQNPRDLLVTPMAHIDDVGIVDNPFCIVVSNAPANTPTPDFIADALATAETFSAHYDASADIAMTDETAFSLHSFIVLSADVCPTELSELGEHFCISERLKRRFFTEKSMTRGDTPILVFNHHRAVYVTLDEAEANDLIELVSLNAKRQ